MTTPCAECARNLMAVHTAKVEMEHKDQVINALKAQVRDLEARVAEKGKKK